MKIIHLSDTHLLGKIKQNLFGIDPFLRLEKAVSSINRYHFDADFVAITGDLTNNGDKKAYKFLKEILSKLNIPYCLILGNHDNFDIFREVFHTKERSKYLQYELQIGKYQFIFLDTTIRGEEKGTLCKERLKWLKESIRKDRDVFIFMHHFPLDSQLNWMDKNANFIDRDDFLKTISKIPNIRHIFCGHLHRNIFANFKHISISCTKSTAFEVAFNPQENEDILTIDEKPSYAVVNIDKNSVVINNHEFLTEDLVFSGMSW